MCSNVGGAASNSWHVGSQNYRATNSQRYGCEIRSGGPRGENFKTDGGHTRTSNYEH